MNKAARPKRKQAAQSGEVHSQIALEAAQLRKAPRHGVRDAAELPAVNALLATARASIERSIPNQFNHEGKTYFLRVSLRMARLMVFDSATAANPMVLALTGSLNEFGHTPVKT